METLNEKLNSTKNNIVKVKKVKKEKVIVIEANNFNVFYSSVIIDFNNYEY